VFNDFAVIVLQIQTVYKFLAVFLYCPPLQLAISACAYFAKNVTILKFSSWASLRLLCRLLLFGRLYFVVEKFNRY